MSQQDRENFDDSADFRRLAHKYDDVKTESLSGTEFRTLRNGYKKLALRALGRATTIVTTNNNAGCGLLKFCDPSIVIVDECGQSSEIDALIPLTRWASTQSRILLGDEKQLQPTVTSRLFNEFHPQMFLSLFARLRNLNWHEEGLDTQYRMDSEISFFLRTVVYERLLFDAPARQPGQHRPLNINVKQIMREQHNRHFSSLIFTADYRRLSPMAHP